MGIRVVLDPGWETFPAGAFMGEWPVEPDGSVRCPPDRGNWTGRVKWKAHGQGAYYLSFGRTRGAPRPFPVEVEIDLDMARESLQGARDSEWVRLEDFLARHQGR